MFAAPQSEITAGQLALPNLHITKPRVISLYKYLQNCRNGVWKAMMEASVYQEIAARTGGNVYIGVVGPVRTGKSTFIKRFMETIVLPAVEDEYALERARDELPQCASGRTIMTAEPKFIPETWLMPAMPSPRALNQPRRS